MNRNKKITNREIFKRLEEYLPLDISGIETGDAVIRYVGTNEEERQLLVEAELFGPVQCLPGRYVFAFRHKSKSYIAIPFSDARNPEPFMRGVLGLVQHAGIMTILWSHHQFPLSEADDFGYQLANSVFSHNGAFELKELQPFFKNVEVWEVDSDEYTFETDQNFYRLFGGRFIESPQQLSLEFSSTTLMKMKRLLEDHTGNIVSEAVFRGLTATHWQHSYLEVYRCIERLYSVPYLKELCDSMEQKITVLDIEDQIEDIIGWRPKEENALEKLIVSLKNQTIITSIQNELSSGSMGNIGVAKGIYRLRNGIAHWRAPMNGKSPGSWDNMIGYLCDLVSDLYGTFASFIAS